MIDCVTPWNLVWNYFNPHQCAEIYTITTLSEPITFTQYLPYFLKTFILELGVYYLFLKNRKSLVEMLQIDLILNLATHPVVFFLIPIIIMQFGATYLNYLVIAEVFAPLTEALILGYFYKISYSRAFLAAIAANLFSWSIGIYWI